VSCRDSWTPFAEARSRYITEKREELTTKAVIEVRKLLNLPGIQFFDPVLKGKSMDDNC
jgi:hypothetical protein